MNDKNNSHDQMFQDGIKVLEDALILFINLNSPHGKVISVALQGIILTARMIYDSFAKENENDRKKL